MRHLLPGFSCVQPVGYNPVITYRHLWYLTIEIVGELIRNLIRQLFHRHVPDDTVLTYQYGIHLAASQGCVVGCEDASSASLIDHLYPRPSSSLDYLSNHAQHREGRRLVIVVQRAEHHLNLG